MLVLKTKGKDKSVLLVMWQPLNRRLHGRAQGLFCSSALEINFRPKISLASSRLAAPGSQKMNS